MLIGTVVDVDALVRREEEPDLRGDYSVSTYRVEVVVPGLGEVVEGGDPSGRCEALSQSASSTAGSSSSTVPVEPTVS